MGGQPQTRIVEKKKKQEKVCVGLGIEQGGIKSQREGNN